MTGSGIGSLSLDELAEIARVLDVPLARLVAAVVKALEKPVCDEVAS